MTLPIERRTRRWLLLRHNFRYIAVGATCAAINILFLIGLVFAGLTTTAANVVSLIPMLFIGYGLHVAITFNVKPSLTGLVKFSAGLIAALPLSILTLFVLVDCLHVPVVLAAPVGSLVVFVWTYLATHLSIMRLLRD